jgi:oligopeptide/dipeptide ABC transporter ATP-binding protein
LIADEPTTALDVTIQAQILELLKHLEKEYQMALLLITHDLGIIAEMVQEVAVMYAGLIIERAPCQELFSNPAHPYTQGLLASLPTLQAKDKKIQPIPGRVPSATAKLEGCRFHPRCSRKEKDCAHQVPSFQEITPGHWVRCFKI